jgi:hypothetical protein
MFTVKDLQERYEVTEKTVLSWIHSGELKALQLGRKLGSRKPRWRVTPEALAAFEALRAFTPRAEPIKAPRRKKADGVHEFIR